MGCMVRAVPEAVEREKSVQTRHVSPSGLLLRSVFKSFKPCASEGELARYTDYYSVAFSFPAFLASTSLKR